MKLLFSSSSSSAIQLLCCVLALVAVGLALSPSAPAGSSRTPQQQQVQSRSAFLSSALAATALSFLAPPQAAHAATSNNDSDAATKGTKKDPKFEACLSQCMYDCTKPKGSEQRSRTECLPDCKKQCATTKQQLLLGLPK
jgi:hypothetical protein